MSMPAFFAALLILATSALSYLAALSLWSMVLNVPEPLASRLVSCYIASFHNPTAEREPAMYAVFEDGSRQYRVSEGDVVKLDYREAEEGTRLTFERVLLYQSGDDTRIGQPLVEGTRILGDVVGHPSIKLYIQHFRRRKNYRRLKGHRQHYTAVQIKHILLPGMEEPVTPPPTPPPSEPAVQQTPAVPSPAPEPAPSTPPTPTAPPETPS
jgi:large subunit ribosomal protein L21